MFDALKSADALLVDKDFGEGITSTPLLCMVRHSFPKLPIIRWTGGYEDKPYARYLGVSCIQKPSKMNEDEFVEIFQKALEEQNLILSGPMGILAALDEIAEPDRHAAETKAGRLKQLTQIARLAHSEQVDSGNPRYPWAITGQPGETTKHELGHAVCDGYLAAEDIRPLLSDLQKVVEKFRAADNIDRRFRVCADFIASGNLDELELVRHCY